VIQQAVNAPKRSGTLLPVLRVIQLRASCVQTLVCNTVVQREHLEMGSEIHSSSLHPMLARSHHPANPKFGRHAGLLGPGHSPLPFAPAAPGNNAVPLD
jgi:hypothetical protein